MDALRRLRIAKLTAHAIRTKRFRVMVTANGKLRISQNRKEANENSLRQFFWIIIM